MLLVGELGLNCGMHKYVRVWSAQDTWKYVQLRADSLVIGEAPRKNYMDMWEDQWPQIFSLKMVSEEILLRSYKYIYYNAEDDDLDFVPKYICYMQYRMIYLLKDEKAILKRIEKSKAAPRGEADAGSNPPSDIDRYSTGMETVSRSGSEVGWSSSPRSTGTVDKKKEQVVQSTRQKTTTSSTAKGFRQVDDLPELQGPMPMNIGSPIPV
jgi:hypothetical protein